MTPFQENITGGNYKCNRIVVWLLSALVTLLFIVTSRHYFPGGAGSFLEYAQAIIYKTHTQNLANRDIGYPLMLILSGFPWTGSIKGIVAIHGLMAFAMPIAVFSAIGRDYPRIALLCGLLCIATLAPYQFIKLYFHDQTYMFFIVMTAFLFVFYSRTRKIYYFYAMVFSLMMLAMTHIAGVFLFPLFMLLSYRVSDIHRSHYYLCLMIFALTIVGSYHHRRHVMEIPLSEPAPSAVGYQLFYNIYSHATEMDVKLTPEMGPGMQRLADEIRKEFPNPSKHPKLLWYKLHCNCNFYQEALDFTDADDFVDSIFSRTQAEYFMIFRSIPALEKDNTIFFTTSWEVVSKYPFYPLKYTGKNLYHYLFQPGFMMPRMLDRPSMQRNEPEFYPHLSGITYEAGLTELAANEMESDPLRRGFRWLMPYEQMMYDQWRAYYDYLNLFSAVFAFIGLLGAITIYISYKMPGMTFKKETVVLDHGDLGRVFISTFTILFYHALVTSIFADPVYRYHYLTVPVQIMCAGYGLAMIANLWNIRHIKHYAATR